MHYETRLSLITWEQTSQIHLGSLQWLGIVRHQDFVWAKTDPDLCRKMAPLSRNGFNKLFKPHSEWKYLSPLGRPNSTKSTSSGPLFSLLCMFSVVTLIADFVCRITVMMNGLLDLIGIDPTSYSPLILKSTVSLAFRLLLYLIVGFLLFHCVPHSLRQNNMHTFRISSW